MKVYQLYGTDDVLLSKAFMSKKTI